MITAAAPAFCPNTARATRAQVPRAVTTIFPTTPAFVYSAGSQPSEMPPVLVFSTLTGSAPAGRAAPLALIAVRVVPVLNATAALGKDGVGSLAATLRAPVPVEGDPTRYGLVPELPAEATTITPLFAALVEATALGSSTEPKGEPSDMLITSMSLSTAHSMASTVTSVDPAHPKTRTAYRSALGATPGPTFQLWAEMVLAS